METLHRLHRMLAESTLFLDEETAAVSDCIRQIEADQELQDQLRQQKIKKTEQYNDLRRLAASRHCILEDMTSEIQAQFGTDVPPPVRKMFRVLLSEQIKIVKARDELAAELGITAPSTSPATPTSPASPATHHSASPAQPTLTRPVQTNDAPHDAPGRPESPDPSPNPSPELSFHYEHYEPGSCLHVVKEEEEGEAEA